MVQAVENLTSISGRVVARKPHPTLDYYDVVLLKIEKAEPIQGRPDLLSGQVGAELEVSVRRELLGTAAPGAQLRCRAKRTADGAMCEARPRSDDFAIKPVI